MNKQPSKYVYNYTEKFKLTFTIAAKKKSVQKG